MLSGDEVETLNDAIQAMSREDVAFQLRHFKARFPIDFTDAFFASEPLGRLRHILFGLCLHSQQMLDMTPARMAA